MAAAQGKVGWSPGGVKYPELKHTLKNMGWENITIDDVMYFSKYHPSESRIGAFFHIEEKRGMYTITAMYTDFEEFWASFSHTVPEQKHIPNYVLRYIVGKADCMIDGLADPAHRKAYLEHRL